MLFGFVSISLRIMTNGKEVYQRKKLLLYFVNKSMYFSSHFSKEFVCKKEYYFFMSYHFFETGGAKPAKPCMGGFFIFGSLWLQNNRKL